MTIKPLFDKIVVKALEAEEKTASGLYLPTSAQEKPQVAEVVAVGPGGLIDGKEVKMEVKVGDHILYSKYSGSEFKLEDLDVTIIKQSDVLAIIND